MSVRWNKVGGSGSDKHYEDKYVWELLRERNVLSQQLDLVKREGEEWNRKLVRENKVLSDKNASLKSGLLRKANENVCLRVKLEREGKELALIKKERKELTRQVKLLRRKLAAEREQRTNENVSIPEVEVDVKKGEQGQKMDQKEGEDYQGEEMDMGGGEQGEEIDNNGEGEKMDNKGEGEQGDHQSVHEPQLAEIQSIVENGKREGKAVDNLEGEAEKVGKEAVGTVEVPEIEAEKEGERAVVVERDGHEVTGAAVVEEEEEEEEELSIQDDKEDEADQQKNINRNGLFITVTDLRVPTEESAVWSGSELETIVDENEVEYEPLSVDNNNNGEEDDPVDLDRSSGDDGLENAMPPTAAATPSSSQGTATVSERRLDFEGIFGRQPRASGGDDVGEPPESSNPNGVIIEEPKVVEEPKPSSDAAVEGSKSNPAPVELEDDQIPPGPVDLTYSAPPPPPILPPVVGLPTGPTTTAAVANVEHAPPPSTNPNLKIKKGDNKEWSRSEFELLDIDMSGSSDEEELISQHTVSTNDAGRMSPLPPISMPEEGLTKKVVGLSASEKFRLKELEELCLDSDNNKRMSAIKILTEDPTAAAVLLPRLLKHISEELITTVGARDISKLVLLLRTATGFVSTQESSFKEHITKLIPGLVTCITVPDHLGGGSQELWEDSKIRRVAVFVLGEIFKQDDQASSSGDLLQSVREKFRLIIQNKKAPLGALYGGVHGLAVLRSVKVDLLPNLQNVGIRVSDCLTAGYSNRQRHSGDKNTAKEIYELVMRTVPPHVEGIPNELAKYQKMFGYFAEGLMNAVRLHRDELLAKATLNGTAANEASVAVVQVPNENQPGTPTTLAAAVATPTQNMTMANEETAPPSIPNVPENDKGAKKKKLGKRKRRYSRRPKRIAKKSAEGLARTRKAKTEQVGAGLSSSAGNDGVRKQIQSRPTTRLPVRRMARTRRPTMKQIESAESNRISRKPKPVMMNERVAIAMARPTTTRKSKKARVGPGRQAANAEWNDIALEKSSLAAVTDVVVDCIIKQRALKPKEKVVARRRSSSSSTNLLVPERTAPPNQNSGVGGMGTAAPMNQEVTKPVFILKNKSAPVDAKIFPPVGSDDDDDTAAKRLIKRLARKANILNKLTQDADATAVPPTTTSTSSSSAAVNKLMTTLKKENDSSSNLASKLRSKIPPPPVNLSATAVAAAVKMKPSNKLSPDINPSSSMRRPMKRRMTHEVNAESESNKLILALDKVASAAVTDVVVDCIINRRALSNREKEQFGRRRRSGSNKSSFQIPNLTPPAPVENEVAPGAGPSKSTAMTMMSTPEKTPRVSLGSSTNKGRLSPDITQLTRRNVALSPDITELTHNQRRNVGLSPDITRGYVGLSPMNFLKRLWWTAAPREGPAPPAPVLLKSRTDQE